MCLLKHKSICQLQPDQVGGSTSHQLDYHSAAPHEKPLSGSFAWHVHASLDVASFFTHPPARPGSLTRAGLTIALAVKRVGPFVVACIRTHGCTAGCQPARRTAPDCLAGQARVGSFTKNRPALSGASPRTPLRSRGLLPHDGCDPVAILRPHSQSKAVSSHLATRREPTPHYRFQPSPFSDKQL